jgi:predicted dehydrogenase
MGLGSIGQRHVRNLLAMGGHELLGYDVRVGSEGFTAGTIQATNALAHVWAWQPEAVLICTAPALHHDLAVQTLERRVATFIEKPIGLSVLEANNLVFLNDDKVTLAVGYQLHASPSVRAFSRGWKILHIWDKQDMGAWPTATYERDILLEFSHEISTCLLWAGSLPATANIVWSDTMNCVIMLGWPDGRLAKIELSGDFDGYSRGAWSDQGNWEFDKAENDEAYADEIEAFLAGKPYCTGEDALQVMQLIERLQ